MDTNFLFQVFSHFGRLSESLETHIKEILREDYFPKRYLLLREGDINRRIYFIKEGIARAFHFRKGKELTLWLMGQGDIMISVYSFFTRKPAIETIELLEDCVLQSITWNQLQKIYVRFPEFNLIGRILTEKYYLKSMEREVLRTLTAKEQYEQLRQNQGHILNRVSMTHIASLLGVSPETVSRIRAMK